MSSSCSQCGQFLSANSEGNLCPTCAGKFAVHLANIGEDSTLGGQTMDGQSIAHYQVTGKLGEGGMGEVYRASDTKLGREVAIKILPDGMASNAQVLTRFEREAKVLAALNHPNIAMIFGIEDVEESKAIVMELVEGETLGERLRKGSMAVEECLPVFRQIASALEAAHEKGIIHRDLKPGNIKFTADGQVKVLDFGLAKPTVEAGEIDTEANTLMAETTMPGTVLGTPAYMSPEQTRGEAVDKRTDVWAFGCCLYECLTGHKPFKARTISDMMAEVLKSDPDFTIVPTETPNDILSLLRRCLEKEPRRRLRDIGDIAIRLEETTETSRILDRPTVSLEAGAAKPRSVSPFRITIGLLMIALAIGLGFYLAGRATPEADESIHSLAILPFENPLKDEGLAVIAGGMQDIIFVKLGAVEGLKLQQRDKTLDEIRVEDNSIARHPVDAYVSGRFFKHNDSVRCTVSLTHRRTDQAEPLGEFSYSTDEELFEFHTQVAEAIAKKVRTNLNKEEQEAIKASSGTENPDAYKTYRKAMEAFYTYTAPGFDNAERLLQDALRIDSGYGEAVSGLAWIPWARTICGGTMVTPEEAVAQSQRILDERRGQVRDVGTLVESEGWLAMYGDRDWTKAERSFREAVAFSRSAQTLMARAFYLLNVEGRYKEALELIDSALEQEPDHLGLLTTKANCLGIPGNYEEALDAANEIVKRESRNWDALLLKGHNLQNLGRTSEALEKVNRAAELSTNSPNCLALRAFIYAQSGREEDALKELAMLDERAKESYVDQVPVAEVDFALGNFDKAFERLESATAMKGGWGLLTLRSRKKINLYGHDPRYWDLLNRLNFPPLPVYHPDHKLEQEMRFGEGRAGTTIAESKKNIRKLAVLPFETIANEENQAWFAEGVTEILRDKLCMIPELKVIAHQSTSQFKDSEDSVPNIARQLKVDALVEGSVIRFGDQVVILARLVDGTSGEIRWRGSFEDSEASLNSLNGKVISEIAESVSITLTPENTAALSRSDTESRMALEYYMQGIAQKGYSEDAYRKKLQFAEKAISEDPNYASAYYLKAWALLNLLYWGFEGGDDPVGQVRSALAQILAVDPGLPEAHAVAGAIAFWIDRDFVSAERHMREAVNVAPNDAVSRYMYGTLLGILGRHQESIEHLRIAQDLDPLSVNVGAELAWAYFRSGDYAQALEASEAIIRLDESSFTGFHNKAFALIGLGKDVEAEKNLRLAYDKSERAPFYLARLGYGLGVLGKKEEAAKLLEEFRGIAEAEPDNMQAHHFGLLYLAMGDDDKAIEWFGRAYVEGDMPIIYLGSNLYWDADRKPLRDNPKYQTLLRRIGLLE